MIDNYMWNSSVFKVMEINFTTSLVADYFRTETPEFPFLRY